MGKDNHDDISSINVNIYEGISHNVETNMEKQNLKNIIIGIIFLILSLIVAVTRSPWLLRWFIPDPLRQYFFIAIFAILGIILIVIGVKKREGLMNEK
jgi:uncharacterized protein YacL